MENLSIFISSWRNKINLLMLIIN